MQTEGTLRDSFSDESLPTQPETCTSRAVILAPPYLHTAFVIFFIIHCCSVLYHVAFILYKNIVLACKVAKENISEMIIQLVHSYHHS